jgi:hypothetical protein
MIREMEWLTKVKSHDQGDQAAQADRGQRGEAAGGARNVTWARF